MSDGKKAPEQLQWHLMTSPLSAYVPFDDFMQGKRLRSQVLNEFPRYTSGNWDGEGARPISRAAIERAGYILEHLPSHVPPPEAAPGVDGTIGLDWENERGTICIDVSDDVRVHYFIELHDQRKEEARADPSEPEFLDKLSRAFLTMFPAPRLRLQVVPGARTDTATHQETSSQTRTARVA